MINREIQITDIFGQLNGRVSPGIMNRVGELGRIPDEGPGRYCVPRVLQTQAVLEREKVGRERTKAQGIHFPQTKTERRSWNLNHKISR